MRVVEVRCACCGSKGTVESSKEISPTLKQLYCRCRNIECCHAWVTNMEFSHTIAASAKSMPPALREKLRHTSPTQQKSLFAELA